MDSGGVGVAREPQAFLKDGDVVRIEVDQAGVGEQSKESGGITVAGEYQQQAIKETKIAIEEMIRFVSKLSEETIRWKPSAEEWLIMQVVAHVVEAIPFWLGEINQIRQHSDEVWGRDHTHQGRLEAVQESRVDQLPVEELLQALAQLPEQTEQRAEAS